MKAADWRTAFALQALSDFNVFKRLSKADDMPVCHQLHYLQMATEKLAKAFASPIHSLVPPRKTHKGFSEFLKTAKSNSRLLAISGFMNPRQFESYIDSIRPIALMVEELAPDIHPPDMNPEYPWMAEAQSINDKSCGCGQVFIPAHYPFEEYDFKRNPRFAKFFEFLGDCMIYLQEEIDAQQQF